MKSSANYVYLIINASSWAFRADELPYFVKHWAALCLFHHISGEDEGGVGDTIVVTLTFELKFRVLVNGITRIFITSAIEGARGSL